MSRLRRVSLFVPLLALMGLGSTRAAWSVSCETSRVDQVDYVVCRVDLSREDLRLVYADTGGVRFGHFEVLRASLARQHRKLAFATNAGMFRPDFRPVGLLVIDGQTIAPINRAAAPGNFFLQPNGVFLVDAAGARVLATDEYRDLEPRFATQSGPMLVHRGQIPASSAFRAGSMSRHIRNGVCVPAARTAAFVISDAPVTFFEFAKFFQQTLRCDEALYLDGSISSLYAPPLRRADDRADLGPMFAVVE
jgi:uncharacterized protein YigE (DUF2233 family)